VLYIGLIPATLALAIALFIKQTKERSHGEYGDRFLVSLFLVILVGQYALTQIYYPFNSGIHKTQRLKETALFRQLGPDDRVGIVSNRLNEIEEKVHNEIGYTDKDASLELSLAMQAYPEVTKYQSNNTMHGDYISGLGPGVYTKGANFTSPRLVNYHNRILKKDENAQRIFMRTKAYLQIGQASVDSKLLDVAGINYIISSLPLENDKLELVTRGDSYYIYRNKKTVEKFYFAYDIKTIKDKEETLNILESNQFTPGVDAIIEGQLDIMTKGSEIGDVKILEYSQGRIKLFAKNSGSRLLVINEGYHPGWKAFSNGQELKINRTNYLFMGLLLEKGRHDIELRFSQPAFKFGLIISFFSFGMISLIIITRYKKVIL